MKIAFLLLFQTLLGFSNIVTHHMENDFSAPCLNIDNEELYTSTSLQEAVTCYEGELNAMFDNECIDIPYSSELYKNAYLAHYHLGVIDKKEQAYSSAKYHFTKSIEMAKKGYEGDDQKRQVFDSLYEMGHMAYKKEDYNQAIEKLQEALGMIESSHKLDAIRYNQVRFLLALCYKAQGSIRKYERYIQTCYKNNKTLNIERKGKAPDSYSEVIGELCKRKRASIDLTTCHFGDPRKTANAYYSCALHHYHQKTVLFGQVPPDFFPYAKHAVKGYEDSNVSATDNLHFKLGLNHFSKDQHQEAISHFSKIVRKPFRWNFLPACIELTASYAGLGLSYFVRPNALYYSNVNSFAIAMIYLDCFVFLFIEKMYITKTSRQGKSIHLHLAQEKITDIVFMGEKYVLIVIGTKLMILQRQENQPIVAPMHFLVNSPIQRVTISPDEKYIGIVSLGRMTMTDVESGKRQTSPLRVRDFTFTQKGDLLTLEDRDLKIYMAKNIQKIDNLQENMCSLFTHPESPCSIDVASGGKFLLSATTDRVYVFSKEPYIPTTRMIADITQFPTNVIEVLKNFTGPYGLITVLSLAKSDAYRLKISPDNKKVAVLSKEYLYIYEVDDDLAFELTVTHPISCNLTDTSRLFWSPESSKIFITGYLIDPIVKSRIYGVRVYRYKDTSLRRCFLPPFVKERQERSLYEGLRIKNCNFSKDEKYIGLIKEGEDHFQIKRYVKDAQEERGALYEMPSACAFSAYVLAVCLHGMIYICYIET